MALAQLVKQVTVVFRGLAAARESIRVAQDRQTSAPEIDRWEKLMLKEVSDLLKRNNQNTFQCSIFVPLKSSDIFTVSLIRSYMYSNISYFSEDI